MKIETSIVVRGSERKNPKAKAGSHRRTDLKYMTLSKKKKEQEGDPELFALLHFALRAANGRA